MSILIVYLNKNKYKTKYEDVQKKNEKKILIDTPNTFSKFIKIQITRYKFCYHDIYIDGGK